MEAKPIGFEGLFRREYPALVSLGVAMTGDRSLAEDCAQEALWRASRNWPTVATLDRPGAWCRRVTVNLLLDDRRRREREGRALRRLGPPTPAAAPVEPTTEAFWAAVRALPERQRAAVALFYVEDCSIADIAEALDIAEGTAKSTLFKARTTLARTMLAEVAR